MTFNSNEIKKMNFVKYLGVIIDENLTWKNYIEIINNKISKNIRVFLFKSLFTCFQKPKNLFIVHSHLHQLC